MGTGVSSLDAPATQVKANQEIDKQIRRDQKEMTATIKLLLLGPGECGKSTILKQMRILHASGFSESEYQIQKSVVHENVMNAIVTLVTVMKSLGISYSTEFAEDDAKYVVKVNGDTRSCMKSYDWPFLDCELVGCIRRLWQDDGVQKCYSRRSEFQLADSAKYFLDDVDRVGHPDYFPTVDDILHSRTVTNGIIEVPFEMKKKKFKVFDVCGQRSDRRKWIHCFDSVNAIIFMVAISEYDMVLREDGRTNRLHDAVNLFETICDSRWFKKTNFILFLNKKDLFEEKIQLKPITLAFPDYNGPMTFVDSVEYISGKFMSQNREASRTIYDHLTCATDTNQMDLVLTTVMDIIIGQNLSQLGVK